ncbi:MAG: hypothetical protein E3J88_03590 [Anaerolineales bacterium]|nr:MAG: hypothetical protein E3J88_03590 [Anaerolineales bacterium]
MKNIEHFEIKSEIGRGGMATVYLAHDPRFDRDVAIKLLPREFLHDPQFKIRFEREAKTIAKLEHPAIVPVYDYGEIDGQPYLVMRYMQGGSLENRLEKGPLSVDEILKIIERIASALSEAHAQRVIHRDLKPGNILFDTRGDAYLSDFGIAKLQEASARITGSAIIGTPAYMSPEQVHGEEEIDGRSDVYALGIILYEMLTGQKPFKAETPAKLLMCHLLDPVPRILDEKDDLPPGIDGVTSRALAKEPDDRYSIATDLSEALRSVITGEKQIQQVTKEITEKLTREVPQTIKSKVRGKEEKGRSTFPIWGWVITGFILIGLLIGGGFFIRQGQAGKGPLAFLATSTPLPLPAFIPPEMTSPTSHSIATNPPTTIPTITHPPTPGIGSTIISPVDGSTMVYVPEGEFLMGSEDGFENKRPVHMVYLDAFWIDQTEVTNDMFAVFLNAQGNQMEGGENWLDVGDVDAQIIWEGGEWKPKSRYVYHPVIEVTWHGAQAYCEWAGKRLPTEAEWEKAARGLDGRAYPWGNQFDSSLVNLDDETSDDTKTIICTPSGCDGYSKTAPVGSFPSGASPYGAMDMAGNVWEWVFDWYDEEYYAVSPLNNPWGPSSGPAHVVRGGSWLNYENDARTTYREWLKTMTSSNGVGFRCVLLP